MHTGNTYSGHLPPGVAGHAGAARIAEGGEEFLDRWAVVAELAGDVAFVVPASHFNPAELSRVSSASIAWKFSFGLASDEKV